MQQNDNLFEQIRDHLQEQAKNGERIDTETELAKRFGVTRYRIRKELDILTQTVCATRFRCVLTWLTLTCRNLLKLALWWNALLCR